MRVDREMIRSDDAGRVRTRISRVDGERGELRIGGYRVEELVHRISYEEAVYLLWEGCLTPIN